MPYRLLLVNEEIGIRVPLADSLRVAGFEIEIAEDGESALEMAPEGGFDLIVLDVVLPGKDGLLVCQELRRGGVNTPVLMLTAKADLEDRVRGFAAGADDYIATSCEFVELIARIKAIVRRSQSSAPVNTKIEQVYEFGDLRVDLPQAAVWRGDERVSLSTMEYELLRYFIVHAGKVLPRSRLLEEVWLGQAKAESRTVDVHVTSLRKKIERNSAYPRWIRTVRGQGYKFLPEE